MAGSSLHALPPPVLGGSPRVLVVVAPYYRDIAEALVAGAVAVLAAAGAREEVVEVPGALEIPTAIRLASRSYHYEGYVALGCVIRGETTHYDTVCNDSSRGIMLLGLEGLCIGNGILTVENHAQALVRATEQDKGGGAAAAALHLMALARRFRPGSRAPDPVPDILVAGHHAGGPAGRGKG